MNRLIVVSTLLVISGLFISASAQSTDTWTISADSAAMALRVGNVTDAYRLGLKAAMTLKSDSEADSVWLAVIGITSQLPDSVEVVTLLKAGGYYLDKNDVEKAGVYLVKAIELGERLHLPKYYLEGYLLMARIKLRAGERNMAEQLYKSVLADTASQQYPFRRIEALVGLIDTYLNTYQFDSAGVVAKEALVQLQQQPDYKKKHLYPIVRMQLARWAYLSNNLTQAIQEIEESYSVARQTMPNDPVLISIGYFYMQIISDINDEKALEATQTARRVLQRLPNFTQHPYYLLLLSNEISMYRVLDRKDRSVLLADSVFQHHSLDELCQLRGFSSFLHQANRTYIDARRNAELEGIAKKTTELLGKPGQTRIDSSYFYSILGHYYQYQRNFPEAVRCLKEELRLDSTGKGVSYINHSLKNRLAICQAKAGHRADAYVTYDHLRQEFDQNARYNLWLMSEAERDNYLRTSMINGLFLHTIGRTDPQPNEIGLAYDYKLLKQGVRLKIGKAINQFIHSFPQADSGLVMAQQLVDIRARLADRTLKIERIEHKQLQQTADSLERLLGHHVRLIDQSLKPVRWQDIRARLKPGEAAIELIWYDNYSMNYQQPDSNRYSALIIRPEWTVPKVVHLPIPTDDTLNTQDHTAEEIAFSRSADYYIKYIYSAENQKTVFETFWNPIAQMLGTVKRIYIALDGAYQQLSLPTIQNPKTKKYLVDELEIVRLNSTQDILEPPLAYTNRVAELIGFPAYSLRKQNADKSLVAQRGDRKIRIRNGLSFAELPYTKAEVKELAALFKTYRLTPHVRIDSSASEMAFRQMRSPRILHVATHGYRLDSSRNISAQLLTCGLVLAGAADTVAQQSNSDGILSGYEASLLNLHGTELVTLSACETGAGDYFEGEGVFGLQRAFLLAGAKSVLMSLWKVNDQLTKQFMLDFYRNWLSGISKTQALQKAQIKLRKQYPHPYYWGAFVLLGQ